MCNFCLEQTWRVCNATSNGVSLCCVSMNGLLGLKSMLSLQAVTSDNSVKITLFLHCF